MTNAQVLKAFALQSGQRGLMICQALELMQQVMDTVQIQQLLLFLQANHIEMAEELDGVGALDIGTLAEEMAEVVLAEDQGEVHDFEGNDHND